MANQVDPTILELDEHQCWELLRSQEVGRLAVAIANHPDIFPINYVVDHASVVFRTAEGTKLAAAVLGESVAFETDGESDGEAWSVVIKGRALEIERMYELFDALELPLYPWHVGPKHRFVRILPEVVTGRRFRVVDRVAAHAGEPPQHRAAPD
ncbi:MAG TPA: pyridoxamine 5'-phosphate oxidase family protein [Ilumatobacter sp.]|jgi:nitroimidazol reductase NimA-like FMN-containing flavoprotein (pyridoxamine 5'-phosphate oxidase superfamily)|nr:pyridoxamine 5'-phosphate oxidase family protein [Ilumatobacter sp.]